MRGRRTENRRAFARWAWLAVLGLSAFMFVRMGCGDDDDDDGGGSTTKPRPRSASARARSTWSPGPATSRTARRPEGRLGHRLREGDRLRGQRQDRQHLRRDGAADADRRLRRRLGVRRRQPAADRGRRRAPGQHRPGRPTTRTSVDALKDQPYNTVDGVRVRDPARSRMRTCSCTTPRTSSPRRSR